jgi:hypothetical protein
MAGTARRVALRVGDVARPKPLYQIRNRRDGIARRHPQGARRRAVSLQGMIDAAPVAPGKRDRGTAGGSISDLAMGNEVVVRGAERAWQGARRRAGRAEAASQSAAEEGYITREGAGVIHRPKGLATGMALVKVD